MSSHVPDFMGESSRACEPGDACEQRALNRVDASFRAGMHVAGAVPPYIVGFI